MPELPKGATAAFCFGGKHAIEKDVNWTLVRATHIDGEWWTSSSSGLSVVVCEHHPLKEGL